MMLLFSPCKRCPCPCSEDGCVLRSCEESLAGIILHRPPSLWFAWVRSGCAGPLGAGAGVGARDPRAYIYICMYSFILSFFHSYIHTYIRSFIHSFVASIIPPARNAFPCVTKHYFQFVIIWIMLAAQAPAKKQTCWLSIWVLD